MPKAELHVHLEGSIVPELALRLAARRGVTLPGAEGGVEGLREAYRFRRFTDFIALYVALSRCLERPEDFCDAVVGVAARLGAQQVRWAELTFTPMTHVARGVDADAMLAGLAEGRQRARAEHGVEIAWVFDVVRSFPDQAAPTLDLAVRGREQGVISLGVGGPEGPRWPVDAMAPVFARAKAEGLHSVPHAGEQDGPESIRANLELLGAERIGHGVRCVEDPALMATLRERGIPLELCPTSNVVLGFYPSLAEHPLPRLLAAGLPLSINSDDPPLFGTTLVEEYRRCAASFAWDRAQVLAVAAAAVEHSFMSAAGKRALLAEQAEVARTCA
nr:adenosine deaminase [Pseudenhygromyxa sp. WMMC2535]